MPRKKIPRKKPQKECIRIGSRVSISIDTDKSPFWQINYQLHGRQIRKSLKTASLKAAKRQAAKKDLELEAGVAEAPASEKATVAKVAEQRRKRKAQQDKNPKTIQQYELHDRKLMAFLPRGGETPMMQLTLSVLEAFEAKLSSEGVAAPPKPGLRGKRKTRRLKPKTVRDVMKSTRGLIDFAVKRGLIPHDPAATYELPEAPDTDIVVFTPQERAGLYADPEMGEVWEFFCHTCLRAGEFIWLLKDDVVLDDDGRPASIRIQPKTCPFTGQKWTPKHGKSRIVPLTDRASEILAKAMKQSTSPWAFQSPDSRGPQEGKWTYGPLLRRLHLRLCEMEAKRRSLHVLRHTGATFYANDAGMPVAQLQKFLGHQRLAETQRYLHPSTEDMAASLKRVDFSRLAGKEDNAT